MMTAPRTPGPASANLQGRKPRDVGHCGASDAMEISALAVCCRRALTAFLGSDELGRSIAMGRTDVVRRGAALECLDDDHAAAAARTRMRERFGLVGLGAVGILGLWLCRRHVAQAARSGDVVGACAAGEQAVVTDAVEALRQDV